LEADDDEESRHALSDPTDSSRSCSDWEEGKRVFIFNEDFSTSLSSSSRVPSRDSSSSERPQAEIHVETVMPPERKSRRPGKGEREKYKAFVEELKARIRSDPRNFDPDAVKLPKELERTSQSQAKMTAFLKEHQRQVIADEAAQQRSSSSSAHSCHIKSTQQKAAPKRCTKLRL